MPFDLQAVYYGGTIGLTGGTPFAFDNAMGLGAASIRRLAERGPQQDGDTDLGYRADPNVLTLSFVFSGTSAADLDSKRDLLQQVFMPTVEPMHLRVIRDDGGTRQLDVFRTGPLDIPLIPVNRPGNLHRAVVQVKASDPIWYDPQPGTAQTAGSVAWYLAANTIGSANVLETWENIGTVTNWSYAGTIADGDGWSLAARAVRFNTETTLEYMFNVGSATYFRREPVPATYAVKMRSFDDPIKSEFFMEPGTVNYFFVTAANAVLGGTFFFYRNTTLLFNQSPAGGLSETPRRWRTNFSGTAAGWGTPILRAALYDIGLTATQIAALNQTMVSADIANVVTYVGDWKDNPIVRIYGPISDAVLTNAATGEKLDFTGYTIGSADYYEIDTRHGYKTVKTAAGDSKISELSQDSDLASFHLAPASEVDGGVNVLTLAGSAIGPAALARVVYHNRYVSF